MTQKTTNVNELRSQAVVPWSDSSNISPNYACLKIPELLILKGEV